MLKLYLQDTLTDLEMYNTFGLSREADFYNCLDSMTTDQREIVAALIPKVYYAESGDAETDARKIILMEDLSRKGERRR